jgi:hypothetical protein
MLWLAKEIVVKHIFHPALYTQKYILKYPET